MRELLQSRRGIKHCLPTSASFASPSTKLSYVGDRAKVSYHLRGECRYRGSCRAASGSSSSSRCSTSRPARRALPTHLELHVPRSRRRHRPTTNKFVL